MAPISNGRIDGHGRKKLVNEPKEDVNDGRKGHENRLDFIPRKQDQIPAQHSGNSSRSPYNRYLGVGHGKSINYPRSQATEQIKGKEFKMAQSGFKVVSEDPQKPHIGNQVPKTAVQEHGGKNGKELPVKQLFRRKTEEINIVLKIIIGG